GIFLLNLKTSTDESVAANLVLVSKDDKGTYVSVYPYIFQSIRDIKSTIFSAIPIIFLLVVLIVFLVNRIYSKSLTDPIIKMNNFTKRSKNEKNTKYDLKINTHDELEELSNNLKDLYETLTENYNDLEKSSKKREIFIRATSHELKTPLQMAILLNESMINRIGKYEDTEKYLPELREKLNKIQVLVDDLVYMNKIDESPIYENLDLSLILKESIENHNNLILEKKLSVKVDGSLIDNVDYDHFRIVFDNLIKNAIENTKNNGEIICKFSDFVSITNYPTKITDENLDKLLDPFVSNSNKKSSGLGLYVAKNLLEDMKYEMKLSYKENKFNVIIGKNLK
ncbi:MAG: HAMP domain-containing histidine kinase, partial [Peptoniphilaceae bacterium]|nr:HAMP domain-containing histidine kinase [Peptoniphilaceae bacterium]